LSVFSSASHVEQRQQAVMQAFLAQLFQALDGIARHQQFQRLVEQPRRWHVLEQRRHVADRRARGRIDGQPELGTQAHGAQHAHRILTVARTRVTDHAQRLLLQVGHAVVVVDDGLARRIVVQRVDGEVAPRGVLGLTAEHVVGQHPAVLVGGGRAFLVQRAEGRDFDGLAPAHDVHDAKAPTDDARATEQRAHFLRRGAGGDVEILGRQTGEQVAHGAAHHEGLVTGLLQHAAHLECGRRDGVAAQAVAFDRHQCRLGGYGEIRAGAAEHLAQQLADHRNAWIGQVISPQS
jgi:hypothetical protein